MMQVQESVTQLQCTCNWLERAAADPSNPIELDALTNEYHSPVEH